MVLGLHFRGYCTAGENLCISMYFVLLTKVGLEHVPQRSMSEMEIFVGHFY